MYVSEVELAPLQETPDSRIRKTLNVDKCSCSMYMIVAFYRVTCETRVNSFGNSRVDETIFHKWHT